ncbi:protein SOSEKI 5-like isoform X1 [Wolffia australiana]
MAAELRTPWNGGGASPERTKIWIEPKPARSSSERKKVPVVYYLSKNGQLEHPHFMEVALSSSDRLFLRGTDPCSSSSFLEFSDFFLCFSADVINRLNSLRGAGMAAMYSWSSKRSYKNGYVWNDLSENDLIVPSHGSEYVLKGSEKSLELSDSSQRPLIRRSKPWRSFELAEYVVYKAESSAENGEKAADASTQTEDSLPWRTRSDVPEVVELGRDEISPPPSSSSSDFMEISARSEVQESSRGRNRASQLLMQLISCGSFSIKDDGFAMVSQYRSRLPGPRAPAGEEKTKKNDPESEPPSLIRSVSDSQRVSKPDLEDEHDQTPSKCLPRRTPRKELSGA